MRIHTLTVLSLVSLLAAQDPNAARVDRDALLRHYAVVEAELRQADAPRDPVLAARRQQVIEHLREYRERGVFGVNADYQGSRVPLFVDPEGRRCAVAWLLDRTGNREVTLAIRNRSNEAWVADLVGEPALTAWLRNNGLSVAEAARIQMPGTSPPTIPVLPPPEPADVPEWTPADGPRPSTPTGAPSPGSEWSPRQPNQATGARAAVGASTPRGTPIDALGAPTWIQWWEWNRGAFEHPPTAVRLPAKGGTVADPRRADAEILLREFANSTDVAVRTAAVQALARIGSASDLSPFLTDSAREVRLMALLGLGRSGSAPHAYALAAMAGKPLQGETLAVLLAGMSMLPEGHVQRSLQRLVIDRLGDARPSVRAAATIAATIVPSDVRRDAARQVLQTATTATQKAEAAQLLGPDADVEDVAVLTALASDRNVEIRRSAALALGRSKHELALPALQSAYELEHESLTRALQLLAIGDHGGKAAGPFLVSELEQGNKPHRALAALALGLWGRERAFGDAADRILQAFEREKNQDQKGAYLLALGLLRHAPSRDFLLTQLGTSASSAVRGAAATALGQLADPVAMPGVSAALANDTCAWVRQQAARALVQFGHGAVPALAQSMRSDLGADVQAAAAFALGGINDVRAAAALLAFAREEGTAAAARAGALLGLGRHFRQHEPSLPAMRFQQNHLLLPAITAWAFAHEL